MLELIVTVAITAAISSIVSAIVASAIAKAKNVKNRSDEERQEAADMRELLLQSIKLTCRLAIYSDRFSIDEKLEAYKDYSSHGWNHQTKTYMDEQVGCDVDEYIKRHAI